MSMSQKNKPFELVTASKLEAQEALDLWCDDKRLDRAQGPENCFINGHRGTGKSMLFRILRHDCQEIICGDEKPDFLSVYFSVTDSELLTQEWSFFQSDMQKGLISESHLCLLIIKQFLIEIKEFPYLIGEENCDSFRKCFYENFKSAFQFSQAEIPTLEADTFEEYIDNCLYVINFERNRITNYIGLKLYMQKPFDGPLFLFDTLLGPLADFVHEKQEKIVYFLIDDGDYLPKSHKIALNSWIGRRKASAVFKVSTMYGYGTYETRTRSAIQHPHDFFQYEIATRYMSHTSEDYVKLLREICEKRLQNAKVTDPDGGYDPNKFFPEDEHQREEMTQIRNELVQQYEEGRNFEGRQVRDNAYRHASSEYMKRLIDGRSSGTFVYSGFDTLAILSSGLVRDFIICAQNMLDRQERQIENGEGVHFIPSSIQSEVVTEHANTVLDEVDDFTKKRMFSDTNPEDWQKVKNLVGGIGYLFKQRMLSSHSERRVFSFAIQGNMPVEIKRLLELGISEGYFMKGHIGRKEGTGRRTLYVLTRRLAPAYSLDVSAYAGYLSIKPEILQELAVRGPKRGEGLEGDFQLSLSFEEFSGDQDDSWTFLTLEEV